MNPAAARIRERALAIIAHGQALLAEADALEGDGMGGEAHLEQAAGGALAGLISVKEACALFRMTDKTLRKFIMGIGAQRRLSGRVLVDVAVVRAHLATPATGKNLPKFTTTAPDGIGHDDHEEQRRAARG